MKLLNVIVLTLALGIAPQLFAQGLSAPDDPSMAPTPAPTTQQDSAAVVASNPKHNDITKSFRNERNAIRRGNAEFNDSNYHRALQYYTEALQENAGSLAARYNYATTLLHLASEDNRGTEADPRLRAAQIYQQIIPDARRHRPEIAEKALYNLGNMSYNDQNYGQAIALYERALMINPDNFNARYNLRLAQLKQEQQDQNQDQQDQQEQQDQQQQQQQEQQEQQQQQQQQEQPQMTQSAQQILQSMQNKENETRQRVEEEPVQGRRGQPEKPW